jgi:hypothetical protein
MSVNKARSVLAIESKKSKAAGIGADAKPVEDARRVLAAAKIEQYIERVVAEAPPLTPEQLDRLALLFRETPVQTK